MGTPRPLSVALVGAVLALAACGDHTGTPRASDGAGASTSTTADTPSPDPSPTVPPLPADLDLTRGLPEDGGDHEVPPQGPDADGAGQVLMCGRVVWPVEQGGATRRLAASASGPEWFDGRELRVYEDPDTAARVLEPARDAVARCRTFDNQVWTPLEEDTGHESVTMGLSYSDGLGSSVFQLTRVGSAVLVVTTYGEGSIASLPAQAAGLTATTRQVAAQLDELP
jgi:hypothetical protein